jgi:phosphatidylglycerophosphatase C
MKAAFFDLDNTLTKRDSLPFWLAACCGWPRTLLAYLLAAAVGPLLPLEGAFDRRGRVKALLLRLTIPGVSEERALAAGDRIRGQVGWNEDMLEALRTHAANGHHVVIITGAATVYVPGLLAGLPYNEIVGTVLAINQGLLTGRIEGVNMVREAKAALVQDWLERHQPEETWGYGNAPHDLQMLKFFDHALVV